MTESIQEIFKRKLVPVRFERTMGLLGATTLGIGALMGAGIYMLIGLAAEKAGPAVWISYLICGLLSLVFYVALAIISVLVVPWENLAQSKAPLVDVALKGLGHRGWLLIAVGGVIASAAALNSTPACSGSADLCHGQRWISADPPRTHPRGQPDPPDGTGRRWVPSRPRSPCDRTVR
jgi:L-asparagine transporter-like permease